MDFSNLHSFLSGDAIIAVSAIAAAFVAKFWKDGSFGRIFQVLIVYAIIASLMKGSALLSTLSAVLHPFGIDVGF